MSGPALSHLTRTYFSVRDHELCIGGIAVTDLAARAGRTPFYAYDRGAVATRVGELRAALPAAIHLHYAIKANPLPELVSAVASLVDGLDVASAGELRVALATGVKPDRISFAGPGKNDAELHDAARTGITINVESERELTVLTRIARETRLRPAVAIRVNPDFELKTSGMKMAGGAKQFGIDAERVPEVLAALREMPLDFRGFHIFSGSQNLRAAAIVEAQQKALDLAVSLAAHAPSPVLSLNLGGGLGIPYFPGDRPLELEPIGANLREIAASARQSLPGAQLVIELGRYIVGEAGAYVCRIIDRKISRGQVFLVTDGGLHHHLAASGNFGQVIRKNYPVVIGNRIGGTATEVASVVGPLCTPLDLLADRMELARAEPGDLVVVLQSGAYGRSASPLRFLGHPEPVEIVV